MAQRLNVQYIQFYTDGSAARKLAPAAPKKTAVLPKPRKLKRKVIYVDPVATLGIVVAVCMLVMMAVGLYQLKAAQDQVTAMEAYVAQLSEENASLSSQYSAGYDIEKIRETALALDMIPAEQATQITIEVPVEQPQEENITLWERIGTFLTGLFA